MAGSSNPVEVGTVASCRRYPVKSLQGLEVPGIEVDRTGVDGDRAFGLIDVASGRLLSAKRTAALLEAAADDEAIVLPDGARLALRGERAATDAALSAWVGRDVRLVEARDAGDVSYEMTFDPPDDDAEYVAIPTPSGSVVDLAHLHLVTTATLAGCAEARPDLDWDVRRFRPNLVLDVDVEPFGEQAWIGQTLSVGGVALVVQGPTVRCAMPLRAQPGGLARQPELFRAMSELNEAFPNHLGLYCEVAEPGRVEVGDPVTVA